MIDRVAERDGEIYRFSGERYRGQRKRREKKAERKTLKKSSPYSNIKKNLASL